MSLIEVKNPIQSREPEQELAFSLSDNFSLSQSFSIASEDTSSTGVTFSPDGFNMFMIGVQTDSIYKYILTAAFDITTASLVGVGFSVASEDIDPRDVAFSPDGFNMFMIGFNTDSVYKYILTTAFDLTTASFSGDSFSVNSEDTQPRGVTFSPDGFNMFMIGNTTDSIYKYILTTAFDIITASLVGVGFSVTSEDTIPTGVIFSPDGFNMFMIGDATRNIYKYILTTAFDLTTASFSGDSFNVASEDTQPRGVTFSPDGFNMFMIGINTDTIYKYDVAFFTNTFRGYVPTFFELKREDIQITTITSQAVGSTTFVKITTTGNFDATQKLKVGDAVTFNSTLYPNKTAIILEKLADPTNLITVNVPFIGDDTGGEGDFVNYRKNWFVQYRLIDPNTDNSGGPKQDEVLNLFDFLFTSQSEISGKVELDISVANNKNRPTIPSDTRNDITLLVQDMFLHFKIQWREIYLDFTGAWISPAFLSNKSDDSPMIVFHGTFLNKQEDGIDISALNEVLLPGTMQSRFWNSIESNNITTQFNFLRSTINDALQQTFFIKITEFDVSKIIIRTTDLVVPNVDGIYNISLLLISILESTLFLKLDVFSVIGGPEYDPAEYKNDEYNTA